MGSDPLVSNEIVAAIVRDVALLVPTVWLLLKGQRRWIADFDRTWLAERR